MHKPPTIYIDTNVLKFSATRLFRLRPRQKVIKWGDITEEVTVHDPVHINPNDKISDPILKRETDLLERVAESAKNIMPIMIEVVKTYATIEEICSVLREVFGEYKSPQIF